MATQVLADNAKVMSKGQVTIPKDVRNVLGVGADDKVTFIVEGNVVRVVNAAVYAMQLLQQHDDGVASTASPPEVIGTVVWAQSRDLLA